MLIGTAFLLMFSLAASVLNYLLLTRAGARIDLELARIDRAMGFDWPLVMAWMARHPSLNLAAKTVYSSMLPQVALLTIMLATKDPQTVYRFLLALALSALVCIAIWSLAPSFGAFSVYPPPPSMALALDQAYAHDLVRLLKDGPGLISPRDTKGLIGFPSYHAVLALLVAWHARRAHLAALAGDLSQRRGPAGDACPGRTSSCRCVGGVSGRGRCAFCRRGAPTGRKNRPAW